MNIYEALKDYGDFIETLEIKYNTTAEDFPWTLRVEQFGVAGAIKPVTKEQIKLLESRIKHAEEMFKRK